MKPYIYINNRLEGNAPLTLASILALVQRPSDIVL
jgi:hypothetical protein